MRMYVSRRSVAFTLIELLVALTIIVALTLLSMPAIGPMIRSSSVDSAASIVRSGLTRARSSAVAQQREGFCWRAKGSVIESGVVAGGVTAASMSVEVDNVDTTVGANYFEWSAPDGTGATTDVSGYVGSNYRWLVSTGGVATGTVTWHFTVPDGGQIGQPITLNVLAKALYSTQYGLQEVTYTVNDETGGTEFTVDQQSGSETWHDFGAFSFLRGTSYTVTMSNSSAKHLVPTTSNKYVLADAVKLESDTSGLSPNSFVAKEMTWNVDQWAGRYYVKVGVINATTGDSTSTFAQIESNTANTITTVTDLVDTSGNVPPMTAGSRFLIHEAGLSSLDSRQTIGSGTDTTSSWTKLPSGAAVSEFDADTDNDNVDDDKTTPARRRALFPIIFTNKGRVKYSTPAGFTDPGYITIKIYSRENPDDENLWRYVRLYRNTGRAATAHKLSDLD